MWQGRSGVAWEEGPREGGLAQTLHRPSVSNRDSFCWETMASLLRDFRAQCSRYEFCPASGKTLI